MRKLLIRLRWLIAGQGAIAGTLNTFAGRALILLINLGTGILSARLLGPAGRGALAVLMLWPTFLFGLLTFGVPSAVRYQIQRMPEAATELFSASLVLGGCFGIVATIVGIVIIPHWDAQYPPSIIEFAQLVMLFTPTIALQNMLQAFLESRGRFGAASRNLYLPPIMTVFGFFGLHFAHRLTPQNVALAYFLPSVIVLIFASWQIRLEIHFPKNLMLRSRQLLNYGSKAYGLDILGNVSGQVDQAIVIGLLSASSFGLYAVAINMSRILGIFQSSITTVLFPKASGLEPTEAIALVGRSARITIPITFAAGLGFVLLVPFVIPLMYGHAYLPDIRLTQILTAEVIIGSVTGVLTQAFMATGRPGLITIFQVGGMATSVPLMFIFIPRLGITGAAYALLGATIVRFVLVLISYPVLLHHRIPQLVLTRQDVDDLRRRLRAVAA